MRRSKYNSRKTEADGILFDSAREAIRYQELKLMERAGAITGLQLQVPFELIPKTDKHRACTYRADFVYTESGRQKVEDSKGYRTPEFLLKRKLLYWRHGVEITEV